MPSLIVGSYRSVSRLFDNNMYQFLEPQPSYWEATAGDSVPDVATLAEEESCEVAIIGGGYTGLSAAYHLARDYQVDVRVLEAGHIGWGASGRNGGFCSIGGSTLELEQALERYGADSVRHFYQSQVDAIELVRALIDDEDMDCAVQGDGELEIACSAASFADLKEYAEARFRIVGLDTRVFTAAEFRERYFDATEQFGAARVRPTFGLHPMRFSNGLCAAAQRHGARIHAHSEVLSWSKDGSTHVLRTANGTIRARKVIMAANGFMPEHLHPSFAGRPLPMISAIVVTRPLADDELTSYRWQTECPSITSRKLLNYFRLLPDRRFMFGGRGHASGSAAGAARIYRQLTARLYELWPEWREVSIDYCWHGLVCMTRRQTPCIGRLTEDPGVFFGFGYHGNGVNTSVWSGKQIAGWLAGSGAQEGRIPAAIPSMMRDMPAKFPLPALRRLYVEGLVTRYRLAEWLQRKKPG